MAADDRSHAGAKRRRLAALRSYRLDGATPEVPFDNVARLAADLFEVPIALVSFVGAQRRTFMGCVGFERCEMDLDEPFCAHTIGSDEVMVVLDASVDPRFRDNMLVTGEPFIRFYAGAPIITSEGHRLGSVCIIDRAPRPPLTERQRAMLEKLAQIVMDQLEHRRSDTLRRAALSMAAATPDAIVCSDENGAVTFWNPAAERLFGHTREEMLGRPLATLVPHELKAHHREVMALRFAEGEDAAARTIEVVGLHRDGSHIPIEISLATWRDGDNLHAGSIVRDLSERDRARERVRHLTLFDGLTELPNRAYFLERVDHALSTASGFAVLKVGLDRFKTVNGTMGLTAGDLVLVTAARRVREVTGPSAIVARLGADEFGVLLVGAETATGAELLAGRLVERLGDPFPVGAALCRLSASIGVVRGPDQSGASEAHGVLRCALLALQHAKAKGGRNFTVFEPRLGQQADQRRHVEEELQGALEREEFELHFQPQVMLPGGDLVGVEALLRWRHPKRGLLSPAVFLSVLETSEMAVPVGCWIIRQACSFVASMAGRGVRLRVGVNLFSAQLRDPGLFDVVTAALAGSGVAPCLFELEITETTVLGLDETTIEPLRRLRDMGVGVAFDDYGTGFASLSLLKRYPLTRLKIDREFVRDLCTDAGDAAIVKAVVALGESLGLDVIAEGIETSAQAEALVTFGCREAQGFLYGKPMAETEFVAHHLTLVAAARTPSFATP